MVLALLVSFVPGYFYLSSSIPFRVNYPTTKLNEIKNGALGEAKCVEVCGPVWLSGLVSSL